MIAGWEGKKAKTSIRKGAKACPFCGCGNISRLRLFGMHILDVEINDPDEFALTCEGCGIVGPEGKTPAEAKRLWNRRSRGRRTP